MKNGTQIPQKTQISQILSLRQAQDTAVFISVHQRLFFMAGESYTKRYTAKEKGVPQSRPVSWRKSIASADDRAAVISYACSGKYELIPPIG